MDNAEILQLVLSTPLSAILLWMLIKEQNNHAETRKQRDQDNREWGKLMLQLVLGRGTGGGMSEADILTRLDNL